MKLYISPLIIFKFQKIYDESEYLRKMIKPDSATSWHIEYECDMSEVRRILTANNIKYRVK